MIETATLPIAYYRLKSGEYDGVDIMQGYLAIKELHRLRALQPIAYASFSSISLQPTGVYLANPDGSEPDVELKSETLKPLFLGE